METSVKVNGKQLYVEIFGPEHAPVLLYLHGGPGSSCYDFIHFQKSLLEPNLRVIAIDQRGVLRSEAIAEDESFGINDLVSDCEALRNELGIDSWTVLGHSFGGQLGLYYALEYPGTVNGLILESPGLDWDYTLKNHLEKMAVEFLAEGMPEMAKKCWKLSAEEMNTNDKMHAFLEAKQPLGARWDRKSIYSEDKKDYFERMVSESGLPIENFQQVWTHAIKLLDEGVVYRSMLPVLKDLDVPTLLLLGKFDDVTTSEQVRTFVENVKLGEVVVFEKSGHFPRIDEPELYAQKVIGFVENNNDHQI